MQLFQLRKKIMSSAMIQLRNIIKEFFHTGLGCFRFAIYSVIAFLVFAIQSLYVTIILTLFL